jgi:hypothetical protein
MHLAEDLAGLACKLRGWDFDAYMARERAMAKRSGKRIVDSIFLDLKFAIEDLSLPTCYVRLARRTLDR